VCGEVLCDVCFFLWVVAVELDAYEGNVVFGEVDGLDGFEFCALDIEDPEIDGGVRLDGCIVEEGCEGFALDGDDAGVVEGDVLPECFLKGWCHEFDDACDGICACGIAPGAFFGKVDCDGRVA